MRCTSSCVMRLAPTVAALFAGILAAIPSGATTLERLPLDDMIQKSTEIVRGRVSSVTSMKRGAVIYTQARIQVSEWWKGKPAATIEVHVPGGAFGRERQTISGAPQLREGTEYVLFLWTGKSGMTQVIGLSQGVFDLKPEAGGKQVEAYRAASTETVVDSKSGEPVVDTPVRMRVSELKSRVARVLTTAE
jgi:hypothetical protein